MTDGIWSSPNGRSIEKSRRASDRTHNETLSVTMPVIRVYDDAGNVIETHEHVGDFKEP